MLPQKQEPGYYHNFDNFIDVVSVLFNNADTYFVYKASLTWISLSLCVCARARVCVCVCVCV